MIYSVFRNLAATSLVCVGAATSSIADTIAYYRFENGSPGQSFGATANHAIADSSGHNFSLNPSNNPVASEEIPEVTIPSTGEKNTLSVHFTGTEDIYAAPGSELSRIAFTNFTIETWVCFDSLDDWQTLIGRDDSGNPGEGTGPQGLFYLSKSSNINPGPDQTENGLRVELVTRDNRILAINSTLGVVTQAWYHVAVVGDAQAGTLSLYVDGTKIGTATGFTGLFVPSKNTAWTLGRGQYKGKPKDFLHGYLDEVRFSDNALSPRQFLNAGRSSPRAISVNSKTEKPASSMARPSSTTS